MSHTTCPITLQSYRQAARVLARAFVDDPVTLVSYPNFNAEKREKALKVDFSIEVRECIRRGYPLQVADNNTIIAAAVIYPPGTYPLPALTQWIFLFNSLRGNGLYDIRNWIHWLNAVEKFHPTEPHYYLEYLGVDPEVQGKRVGTALMASLGAKADEMQVGCYLENANPRNIPFYQRFGFQVVNEKVIIGVPTWFMWRAPATS